MEHSAEYNNAHREKRCAANGKQVGSIREASEKQVRSKWEVFEKQMRSFASQILHKTLIINKNVRR